jgi:hypothetical protein
LILIDDGSRDDSLEVMQNIKNAYPDTDIHIVHHNRPNGHIASYNEAISLCTGDLIHLMAADDVLADMSFYGKSVVELEDDSSCGFVTGRLEWISEDGKRQGTMAGAPFTGKQPSSAWLQEFIKSGNVICGGAVVIWRELQNEIGPYDAGLPYSADFSNWIKAFRLCPSAYNIGKIVYLYRRHPNQMTNKSGSPPAEREKCRRLLMDVGSEVFKQNVVVED